MTDEASEPPDVPHFDSFRERCEPILAWVEERFGPVPKDCGGLT